MVPIGNTEILDIPVGLLTCMVGTGAACLSIFVCVNQYSVYEYKYMSLMALLTYS